MITVEVPLDYIMRMIFLLTFFGFGLYVFIIMFIMDNIEKNRYKKFIMHHLKKAQEYADWRLAAKKWKKEND